jgi:hypothetical protein
MAATPPQPFEHRTGRGETCEGCDSSYTREAYIPGVYRCPKCEAYMGVHDHLLQSYAVLLEQWRAQFGLSREGALQHACEFHGLFDDIQNLLMDGYSLRDHEAIRDAEEAQVFGAEAVK